MDHSLKDVKPIHYTGVSNGNKKKTGYQQSYKTEFTKAVCPREDKTCGTVNKSIHLFYIVFILFT